VKIGEEIGICGLG